MSDILDNLNVLSQKDPEGALDVVASQYQQAAFETEVLPKPSMTLNTIDHIPPLFIAQNCLVRPYSQLRSESILLAPQAGLPVFRHYLQRSRPSNQTIGE